MPLDNDGRSLVTLHDDEGSRMPLHGGEGSHLDRREEAQRGHELLHPPQQKNQLHEPAWLGSPTVSRLLFFVF